MFTDFINRILGAEQKPSPNRLDNIAEPGWKNRSMLLQWSS